MSTHLDVRHDFGHRGRLFLLGATQWLVVTHVTEAGVVLHLLHVLHPASLGRAATGALLGGRLNETASLNWRVSREERRAVGTLGLAAYHKLTLFRNELAVRPVAAVQLGEDEHAAIRDLEGASARHLLEVRNGVVVVRDEVVVDVVIDVRLGDHVLHDDGLGYALDDALGQPLEELLVLGFVVPRVPAMLLAVAAHFYHENNFRHCKICL